MRRLPGYEMRGMRARDGAQAEQGERGVAGPQGEKGEPGDQGPVGPKGDKGDTGPQGDPGQSGPAGPAGSTGAQGAKGDTGATGAAGTNASVLVGTVTLAETALINLALTVRRVTVALSGTVTAGSYVATPVGSPPAGYSIQDCACATAGQITVGILVPVLSIASSYSIPVKIYRLN